MRLAADFYGKVEEPILGDMGEVWSTAAGVG
jgi:hypothetical protein